MAAPDPIRALKPITTPRELKEATVRDYARQQKRIGLEVDSAAIERQAIADLELVDAYQRGLDHSPSYSRPAPPRPEKAKGAIAKAQEEELPFKEPGGPRGVRDRTSLIYANPQLAKDWKWPYAVARIRRILEGACAHRATNARDACQNAEMPKLALDYMRWRAAYMFRYRQSRWNPFCGLNEEDAARKLQRMVYDICDRSTGKLGQWCIPK